MAAELKKRIVVVDHDPAWAGEFERLAAVIRGALGELALAVEHVGSTSVPGLAAKPVLDVAAVVPSADGLPVAVARLAALGYRHRGDLGIAGREAFGRGGDATVPRDGSGAVWMTHHSRSCTRCGSSAGWGEAWAQPCLE